MYYIDDYKKQAVKKVIPYLINFPQIVKILESNSDRYQAIEDVLWNIATNFWVNDSRGIFLNAHANNEVVTITYTDKAEDAFTYGTDKPLYQAYGTGHYYSQASYISGIKKSVSEDKLIRAVKAKIIQNNTNGTIEDLIESLKLFYNATGVKIYESYPLNVSVMLTGNNLELSSSGNYETIKNMLPVCVGLKDIYVDPYAFETFLYSENSSYGDSRYPVLLGETTDIYNYISFSVNLDSQFQEYIKTNHTSFKDDMFTCIAGELTVLNNNSTLFSSTSDSSSISIKIIEEEGAKYFGAMYNGNTYISDVEAVENQRYTIICYNSGTEVKIWFLKNLAIHGQNLDEDMAYISNRIFNVPSSITIDNYTTIDAPIYINCVNDGTQSSDFGDFTYYAIVFGNANTVNNTYNCTEYYTTCYGEKQILFNCLENKNHLNIITANPLVSNILIEQSYYNYKKNHSNGRYMYLDGKSGINYYLPSTPDGSQIDSLNISFDICCPTSLNENIILSNIINKDTDNSSIGINSVGSLYFTFTELIKEQLEDGTTSENTKISTYYTDPNTINLYEYCSIKIEIASSKLFIYKNNNLILEDELSGTILNTPNLLKIGFNNDLSLFYKGIIKNLLYDIKYSKIEDENIIEQGEIILDLPYKNTLKDFTNSIQYTNAGARFITVPQLISDKTGLDLYKNPLISQRS